MENFKTKQERIGIPSLYQGDFEIIIQDKQPKVTNFYILCKKLNFEKEEIRKFALDFRKHVGVSCNIHLYDSESITHLVDVFDSDLISNEDYIKKAEHFIATLFFTDDFMWYPFKDELYYSIKQKP